MNIASTYKEFLGALKGDATFPGLHRELPISGIVGMLFANPTLDLANNTIIRNLDYFNERSSYHIDFFFPGYYTWGGPFSKSDIDIAGPGNDPWHYSTKLFVEFIDDLENASRWKYGGETELLLFDYFEGKPDFTRTTVIKLERAIEDKRIQSINVLFEEVFRAARKNPEIQNVRNRLAFNAGVEKMKDRIEALLNEYSIGIYDASSVFFTKNLSKKD